MIGSEFSPFVTATTLSQCIFYWLLGHLSLLGFLLPHCLHLLSPLLIPLLSDVLKL